MIKISSFFSSTKIGTPFKNTNERTVCIIRVTQLLNLFGWSYVKHKLIRCNQNDSIHIEDVQQMKDNSIISSYPGEKCPELNDDVKRSMMYPCLISLLESRIALISCKLWDKNVIGRDITSQEWNLEGLLCGRWNRCVCNKLKCDGDCPSRSLAVNIGKKQTCFSLSLIWFTLAHSLCDKYKR